MLATRAKALGLGLLGQGLGLAGETEVEHAFGQNRADLQEEVLNVREGGAPGGPSGP